MRRNRLLVLGGTGSRELLNAAQRRGIELVIMTVPKTLATAVMREPMIAIEPLNYAQPLPKIVQSIVDVATKYEVGGIVTVFEFGLMPAMLAAQKLGFPAQSAKAIRNTRDKVQMRRALDAAGMHQIDFAGCRTIDEARAFFERAGGPIILKPSSGTGSDGVALITDRAQLDAAWTMTTGAAGYQGATCESYIDGPEVSVEGFVANGEWVPVAITDKTTNDKFLEIGHAQPTRKTEDVQREIFDYTGRVLNALGVDNCWTHTEVRLGANGPVIIETHTRSGGASIDLLTRRTTGVSTYEVMFDFALGITPAQRPRVTGEAAVVRFVLGEPGVVSRVEMPEQPQSIEHVQIDIRPGDAVNERSASTSRLGHMVGVGSDVDEATRNAEAFRDAIVVHYEGGQQWITPAA